jgi:imidazoleglycerol phosphate synthase glutamine amidotransferase subunit HisH
MRRIGIIDCGISNLTSIYNAIQYLSLDVEIIREPDYLNCCHL